MRRFTKQDSLAGHQAYKVSLPQQHLISPIASMGCSFVFGIKTL